MEQAKILAAESRIKTKIVYIPVRVPVGTLFTILNEVPVVIGQVIPFAVQISIVYGSPLAPESSKTRKTNWELWLDQVKLLLIYKIFVKKIIFYNITLLYDRY